jgi:hypothetical protein
MIEKHLRNTNSNQEDIMSAENNQKEFDQLTNDILTVQCRLTLDEWDKMFNIFMKAEKAGLSLECLSPMTKHNFNYWKNKNENI